MRIIITLAIALAAVAFGPQVYKQIAPDSHVLDSIAGAMNPGSSPAVSGDCASVFLAGKPPTAPVRTSIKAKQLCSMSFAVMHSGMTRTPLWSAEALTPASLAIAKRTQRVSEFEPDTRLDPEDRAELDDYRRSGWDRGHLAPSGDMPGLEAQSESFRLSNIVPQSGTLNRGRWSDLESDVRSQARRHPNTYVVTGVLFQGRSIQTTPSRRVLVPTSIWKAVAIPGVGSVVVIATNENDAKWRTITVDQFKDETEIDPFPGLSASTRNTTLELR